MICNKFYVDWAIRIEVMDVEHFNPILTRKLEQK